jgi:hypothetical protein
MAPPVVLASDVMDKSAALLNDVGRALYTNTIQLPYLAMANESIEQALQAYGIDIQRKNSTAINVAALAVTVALPDDFLMPIELYERAEGSVSESDWVPMQEQDNLIGFVQTSLLGVWSFNNNAINLTGATGDREVLLVYERSLATVTSAASPIDVDKLKRYLSRKTAELCARFIGMNSTLADEILTREVNPAQDDLVRIFVNDMQGSRKRRGSFGLGRGVGVVIR